MTNMLRRALLGCALAIALSGGPARADDDCRGPVSRAEAIDIARSVGLVRLEEVECDDDSEWEVEGWDAAGREIEVEIDSRTGRIREVERD